MEEFQKLGYPIFSQSTLPLDEDMLDRLFGEEVRAKTMSHALDISDAGRTPTRAALITRSGRRNLRLGIRTWSRSRFPASSAGTTRRFMASSKGSSKIRARLTSRLKIWMKTNRADRFGFASRPSTTSWRYRETSSNGASPSSRSSGRWPNTNASCWPRRVRARLPKKRSFRVGSGAGLGPPRRSFRKVLQEELRHILIHLRAGILA